MADKAFSADVLILGGGIGGMCAAITAAEQGASVFVVEKADPRWGGQVPFAGGVFFCLFPDDNKDGWLELNLEDGQFLNDKKWLLKYGEETYPRLTEMVKWGIPFRRDSKGGLLRMDIPMHFHGSLTLVPQTHLIQIILTKNAVSRGVHILNKTYVPDLIVENSCVKGAVGIDLATGDFCTFLAKTVILAVGGCNWGIRRLFTMDYGEAILMAYKAGAELRNAEFGNQYTPVGKENECWVWANDLLENTDGEGIVAKHFPHSSREIGFQTIMSMYKEIIAGKGPIYQNFTQSPERVERLQEIGGANGEGNNLLVHLLKKGIDLSKERIEMKPSLSGHLSPIKTNLNCETTVPGLFAVGDAIFGGCAFQGTLPVGSHPGYPLPFAVVSGCLAGESSGRKAREVLKPECVKKKTINALRNEIFAPLKVKRGYSPYDGIHRIQEAVSPLKYNFVKTEARIKEALRMVDEVKENIPKLVAKDAHDVMRCCEVKSMAFCAELQYKAAHMRTETRGGHIREDYPEKDDKNWLRWIEIKREGEEMKFSKVPVPSD